MRFLLVFKDLQRKSNYNLNGFKDHVHNPRKETVSI